MLLFSESNKTIPNLKSHQKETNRLPEKQMNNHYKKNNKNFKTSNKLNRHEESVHRIEKKFACDKCKLTYSRREHLNRHMITHTSEKINNCEKCGYSSFWKWNFDKHKCLQLKIGNCGSCEGCLRDECRKCRNCKDKLKFGGANKIKKKCIKQKCINVGK